MQIKQFEDKNLAHYSYAIISDCEKKIILIDPARNTPLAQICRQVRCGSVSVRHIILNAPMNK